MTAKFLTNIRQHLPWQYRGNCEGNRPLYDANRWDTLFLSIALALSLTVGLTFLLFSIGIPITRWHGLLYPGILLTTSITLHLRQSNRTSLGSLLCIQLLVHGIALIAVFPFFDLGGDGMASHQEGVLALESEWNPIKDPYFLQATQLKEAYPVVEHSFWVGRGQTRNFSYVLSAIIGKSLGNHELGKGIHLLGGWMAFCAAMAFAGRIFKKSLNQFLFSLIAALNPVICYQFLSYWQDAFVAGVYSAIVFAGILWVMSPRRWSYLFVYIMLCFLISGLKLSGVGFAGLTSGFLYLALWFRGGIKFYLLCLLGALNLFLIGLAGVLMGAWTFHSKIVTPIEEKIEHFDSEMVNAGGTSYTQVLEYHEMNEFLVFLTAMSSTTKPVARKIELKLPFTTDWSELRTFYYFFEDPRAGGMGVFYSGLLLLSGCLFASAFKSERSVSIWICFVLIALLTPLMFVPTYWARWIPQTWLIPLFLCLPGWMVFDRDDSDTPPLFSLRNGLQRLWLLAFQLTALANSLLIVGLYVVGNLFGTHIVKEQLEILKSIPGPVLYGNGSYTSNRKWLLDSGIDYKMTWAPEDWRKNYIQFYRTDTKIFVTDEQLESIQVEGQSLKKALDDLKLEVEHAQKSQWLSDIWVKVDPGEGEDV